MPNIDVKRKTIPKKIRIAVYEKCHGHCAYCGCNLEYKDMQVDHVVSLYWRGGADDISNYMPACRACNFYKSTMPLEEFREHIQTVTERLQRDFTYRIAVKYGVVTEHTEPIRFYFERVGE